MDINNVLKVHEVLMMLGNEATPLRLTIARCLKVTTPIALDFSDKKDEKFNSLVRVDEDGNPVPTEALKTALDAGKINPSDGLPFEAYEFESPEGIKELIDYVEELKKEEVTIKFPSVSLKKKIRLKDEGKEAENVILGELLEAPDSKITAEALLILMEAGIIVE